MAYDHNSNCGECGQPVPASFELCGRCYRADLMRKKRQNNPGYCNSHPERNPTSRGVIALDGEGIDGAYVLLAGSTGEYIERYTPEGLSTVQCFHFLSRLPREPLKWGFAFSYDVNMMLRDLSEEHLERLRERSKVLWGDWFIQHFPGKMFRVKERSTGYGATIWDLYPFIQSSFVKFLDKFDLATDEEIERIARMKDQRADFSSVDPEEIRRYCISECNYLEKGTNLFLELFEAMGYRTNAYYSPGTIAVLEMRRRKIKLHYSDPPQRVKELSANAYYGGRAETTTVGPLPTLRNNAPYYQYDINSAYPFGATNVPCLAHGTWRQSRRVSPYGLYLVRWRTNEGITWGPFPVRPRNGHGSLKYPTSGIGSYWGMEVLAGKRFCRDLEIVEGWRFDSHCRSKPFHYLAEMFEERADLKRRKDNREYVIKLVLNSTYGKLAQRKSVANKVPKYQSLEWAGMITATCRAMLLRHLSDNVVLLATDSLLTSHPLKVKIGEGLGEWSVKELRSPFIVGSGFYFADGIEGRTRGLRRADIDYRALREAWLSDGREGTYTVRFRRFIGYGLALQRIGGLDLWRHFVDQSMEKTFSLFPRRVWRTDDPYDGRTFAPSADDVLNSSLFDELTSGIRDIRRRHHPDDLELWLSESSHDPESFLEAEQPDWIIDLMGG